MLLAFAMGGVTIVESSGELFFFCTLAWGLNLTVLSNLLHSVHRKTQQNRSHLQFQSKWAPFLGVFLGMLLLLTDLTVRLVNTCYGQTCYDIRYSDTLGLYKVGQGWQELPPEYSTYCSFREMIQEHGENGSLTVLGWLFHVLFNAVGFCSLFLGIIYANELPRKVAQTWRAIRQVRAPPVVEAKGDLGAALLGGSRRDPFDFGSA